MANDKERKTYVCSLCHKSMNRKLSFERHKRNCAEKTQGAKSRNFHPYQCPSPKMAQKSAGAFMESFQNRISDMYRGRSSYHEVEERDEDNNRPWSNVMNNIRNINFLNAHSQRKNGFLPITSEVETAETSVMRVALVGLGGHVRGSRDLDTWYTLPETPEPCHVVEMAGPSQLDPVPALHVPAGLAQAGQAGHV